MPIFLTAISKLRRARFTLLLATAPRSFCVGFIVFAVGQTMMLPTRAMATSACINFGSDKTPTRAAHFANYLRSNLEAPQFYSYMFLEGMRSFIASPLSAHAYLRPLTTAEFIELSEVVDRVHAAFGVRYATNAAPDSKYKLGYDQIADVPGKVFQNSFRLTVLAIRLYEPKLFTDRYIENRTVKDLATNQEVRDVIDQFFTEKRYESSRLNLRLLVDRLGKVLHGDDIKKANDEFRRELKRLLDLKLTDEELFLAERPLIDRWKNKLRDRLDAEFSASAASTPIDKKFRRLLEHEAI